MATCYRINIENISSFQMFLSLSKLTVGSDINRTGISGFIIIGQ